MSTPRKASVEYVPPLQSNNLVLIERLVACLNQRNVSYCHWKSNEAIARSLAGDNDLDLLVDRRHAQVFNAVLAELNFKRANASLPRQFPGVEDFYGFDELTGKLVHIHVHYQLVLGEIYLKSVHLPLEKEILKAVDRSSLVPMSAPEYELILFVLRMILRIRWIDILRGRSLSPYKRSELTYLRDRANTPKLQQVLDAYNIPVALFEEMLRAIEAHTYGWHILGIQARLRRTLKPYTRMSAASRIVNMALRRMFVRGSLLFYRQAQKKSLASGGFSIALVGSDGSGKSTLIRELNSWLSPVFHVRTFHMGKPKQSLFSRTINRLVGLARRSQIMLNKVDDATIDGSDFRSSLSLFLILLQDYGIARDRFRTFMAIQRVVGQGHIALVDRYPLPQLREMDTSFVRRHDISVPANLRWLSRKSDDYYKAISLPQQLIVLQVSPEIAVQRQPGDNPDSVARRAQEVQTVASSLDSNIVLLNSQCPLNEVVQELKTAVWQQL